MCIGGILGEFLESLNWELLELPHLPKSMITVTQTPIHTSIKNDARNTYVPHIVYAEGRGAVRNKSRLENC